MSERSDFLSVAAAYDRWSSTYDGYDNPMVFAADQIVRGFTDVQGRDVVELGCGTGRNLAAVKAMGARSVTGLDLSEGMLAKARERDPAFRLLRHDLTRQPVPLPEASADLVLFCLALEHVDDLARVLKEAARLLRPAGRVAIVEIHPFLAQSGTAAHFHDDDGEVRMPTFPHRFSDYLNAFDQAGLRVAACREWRPRDFVEPPPKALKRGPDCPLAVQFLAVRL